MMGEHERHRDEAVGEMVRVRDGVVFRELGGEAVLLDVENATYFGLNATGTCAWMAIARTGDPASAVTALLEEFDVDAATASLDTWVLLQQLLERGLLVPAAPAVPSKDVCHDRTGA